MNLLYEESLSTEEWGQKNECLDSFVPILLSIASGLGVLGRIRLRGLLLLPQVFEHIGTKLRLSRLLSGALLDLGEVFASPGEVALMRVPEGLLLVLFVDEPEAAGFLGRAFVVVELPVKHKGAAPFEGGDHGFDALVVLHLGRVATRGEAVFADEDAFAGDAGLGLQLGFEVVERGVQVVADDALEAVVAGVADEIDIDLREDVVGEALAAFEVGLDKVRLGVVPDFDVFMRRVALRVVDGLLADLEPGDEVVAEVLGEGLFRVKVRPQMPVALPVAEVEFFAAAAVSAQQMRGEVKHLAILQFALRSLEGARAAMRGEGIGPDEEVREWHVEHRTMRRFLRGDLREGLQPGIAPTHIRLRLAKRGLLRDREFHDARPQLRDELRTLQQRLLLRELIPPADGLRAEKQVRRLCRQ